MTQTDQPYEQWTFSPADPAKQELLIALLEDSGFDGFEQRADALLAAGPVGGIDETSVRTVSAEQNVEASREVVAPKNWNAAWEAEYEPVVVPGWCTVRAAFHPPSTDTAHDIVITPKMSFGTGHHATTWLMLDALHDFKLGGKHVLDFGTGTGVLAILAAKLEAASVLAIDNDPWSVENAHENIALNSVTDRVSVVAGTLEAATGATFDLILANINRHVLLATMPNLAAILQPGGTLLMSGLLESDEPVMRQAAERAGLRLAPPQSRDGWILLQASHA